MSNIVKVESSNDIIHKSKNGEILIGDIKKEWIKTPKELGNQKLKVVEQFLTTCMCGEHTATLYVLESTYMTINCKSKGWMWLKKPNDLKELDNLRSLNKNEK